MSEHADLTSWNVADSIKNNLSAVDACESYKGMLAAADYDDQWANPKYIMEKAAHMLTQKDGIYGISHQQIIDWMQTNMAGLIIEKVIFERP